MKNIKNLFMHKMNDAMANFALAFAGGSVHKICFYIFHQPKMPEEVMELNKK